MKTKAGTQDLGHGRRPPPKRSLSADDKQALAAGLDFPPPFSHYHIWGGGSTARKSWHPRAEQLPARCNARSVSPLDAPGATPDAGWEGDIRAIKWRNEEGSVHDGCKGKTRTKAKAKAFQFYENYTTAASIASGDDR